MANINDMTVTLNAYLGTCNDCVWWWREKGQKLGWCTINNDLSSPECIRERAKVFLSPDEPAKILMTTPDYGCVQFAKPSKEGI